MNLSLQLAMSLPKPATQFPLFLPPPPHNHRPATEIRFARWNNANAQKFVRKERTQKELEDQIRFHKRHDSAQSIAQKYNYNPAPPHRTTTGTPSSPSAPSIPGKKSKYSKPDYRNTTSHPAFKPLVRTKQLSPNPKTPNFKVDENGVSYELPEAPFLYQYSYTETPKVKPVKLREPLVSPFGPETMAKPWMGRKPLPESRKNLPEFDSFNLPPPYKKGVKSVQAPGPYLPGSGPKYVRSREEVLGEPLTKEEIEELVTSCRKSYRQLNMGRDGLTHNMLDNIHDLWKRRRVCKIRCLGVCTVDMDNVRQQLEEKTGGKIIAGKGGIVYLFRGRNYNYKSRPRYPLMLWKPVSPVYPRLIKHAPEGLTLEEATEMRRKGRDLTPICKLAKNGVYCNLVKHVREAFEACELVRINCQGLNPSDYRKIGAKLKDLVPCVLLSFEYEHILIWRGREWKSSLPEVKGGPIQLQEKVGGKELALGLSELPSSAPFSSPSSNSLDVRSDHKHVNGVFMGPTDLTEVGTGNKIMLDSPGQSEMGSEDSDLDEMGSDSESVINQLDDQSSNTREAGELVESPWSEAVLLLKMQAVENGMAIVLDDDSLDADIILKKALAFSETAPAGPVFRHQRKKVAVENSEEEAESSKLKEQAEAPTDLRTVVSNSVVRGKGRKGPREKKLKDIKVDYFNVVPEGKLRVDELAKLLM